MPCPKQPQRREHRQPATSSMPHPFPHAKKHWSWMQSPALPVHRQTRWQMMRVQVTKPRLGCTLTTSQADDLPECTCSCWWGITNRRKFGCMTSFKWDSDEIPVKFLCSRPSPKLHWTLLLPQIWKDVQCHDQASLVLCAHINYDLSHCQVFEHYHNKNNSKYDANVEQKHM